MEYSTPIPDVQYKEASKTIKLKEGYNKISFTSEGRNDSFGFRIFDIKIRRVIDSEIESLHDKLFNANSILFNIGAIPCARIIFAELVNFMISFDRMQLYYYHHRTYSYYYEIFIKGMASLFNQKGTYAVFFSD